MVDRRRIHRTIGRELEGVTRSTAEEFIAKARQEAREGRLNLPKRRKVALTLAAAGPLTLSACDRRMARTSNESSSSSARI